MAAHARVRASISHGSLFSLGNFPDAGRGFGSRSGSVRAMKKPSSHSYLRALICSPSSCGANFEDTKFFCRAQRRRFYSEVSFLSWFTRSNSRRDSTTAIPSGLQVSSLVARCLGLCPATCKGAYICISQEYKDRYKDMAPIDTSFRHRDRAEHRADQAHAQVSLQVRPTSLQKRGVRGDSSPRHIRE
jgi:hypothetical protein